jgi:hypothetical protein
MGWEFYIGSVKISFGPSEIEARLLEDYEKITRLEYSGDGVDQAGGQENFDRIMGYRDQIDEELNEYGRGEDLAAIDAAIDGDDEEDDDQQQEEEPWWKFW